MLNILLLPEAVVVVERPQVMPEAAVLVACLLAPYH
jgi:hypothetical protein